MALHPLVRDLWNKAESMFAKRKWVEAVKIYSEILNRIPRGTVPETFIAMVHSRIGVAQLNMGNNEGAVDHLYKAITILVELKKSGEKIDLESLARWYIRLGVAYGNLRKNREGIWAFFQAISIFREMDEKHIMYDRMWYFYAMRYVATLYQRITDYEDAEKYYLEALELVKQMRRKHRPVDEKQVILATIELAELYLRLKKFEKAHGILEDAKEGVEKIRKRDPRAIDPQIIAQLDYYIAVANYRLGRLKEAKKYFRNVYDRLIGLVADGKVIRWQWVGYTLLRMAEIEYYLDNLSDAMRYVSRGLNVLEIRVGRKTPKIKEQLAIGYEMAATFAKKLEAEGVSAVALVMAAWYQKDLSFKKRSKELLESAKKLLNTVAPQEREVIEEAIKSVEENEKPMIPVFVRRARIEIKKPKVNVEKNREREAS